MIEYAVNAPWLDNWPVSVQLWQPGDRTPGSELDLSVSANRNLTVQWRNQDGAVVLAYSEAINDSAFEITSPKRGVVTITASGDDWNVLKSSDRYTLEVIAYGLLYLQIPFALKVPEPGKELLNGVEIYGSPRQILELLGPVPGASVEVFRDLSGGWVKDTRGYWSKPLPPTFNLYGFWVDDRHVRKVDYDKLALAGDRGYALSGNTIYYKGPENLVESYIETAFSVYVWRCLKEATTEVERRTGRFFNRQRIYRETHRGLNRHRQLITRHQPVEVDSTFRLDALSYTRSLYRRYTEADFDNTEAGFYSGGQILHSEGETGVITINQNIWDWWDWGNNQTADYGIGQFQYLPRGENNIELTYVAGYDKTPPDVDEAVCNLAAMRQGIYWNQAISQGLKGMNIGCVNMNFDSLFSQWFPAWQSGADRILERYQHIEVEGI